MIERIAPISEARAKIRSLPKIAISDQIARECLNIAHGFFSPLDGFMSQADLDSVVRRMTLTSGYIWSIPIVFDISGADLSRLGVAPGTSLLLTYQDQPLAVLDVEEIYSYDKEFFCSQIYQTNNKTHPGVLRIYACQDNFISGPITLVNQPIINPPFDRFWKTPRELRQAFTENGWSKVVAHQSRNVPHAGHEWMMKGAWFSAQANGILVSAVIGEKKIGDYIDEAIVLSHDRLRQAGFFVQSSHQTSALLWDMRYAGPREAIFHAIVRKNQGCTHHMFGRDHAGIGDYYDPYAAHRIFDELPYLGIEPILTLEWWYCPVCASVAYEGLCGHRDQKEDLSGTLIRSIIQGGTAPAPITLRTEVLEVVRECASQYGFGSPFVTKEYLKNRTPVMSMTAIDSNTC